MEELDLLVCGAAELATPEGKLARGGSALGQIRVLPQSAVAIHAGKILALGAESQLRQHYRFREVLDAGGGTLLPGFIDAHTHPLFRGTREEEFEQRTQGRSYVEIAQAGGGILSSVRGVRESSDEELLARLLLRLDRFLELGTTTIEAKTGYGLSCAEEERCLRLLQRASQQHPIEIVPTFLGAHEYPEEYRGRKSEYVELLVQEMLPGVAAQGIAEYCDIFTESHVFSLADSLRILTRARELGLRLRLHADQLSLLGGAQLAAQLQADSADHLEYIDEAGIQALGAAGVVPVLCPLVPLTLRQEREAPGRRMVDAGLAPAISTDFNPGSCYLQSLPVVLAFAALRYRFTAAEALCAATLNAAASLGRAARLGSLEVGKDADLVVLDQPNHKHLVYELGRNAVRAVVKRGRVVVRREPLRSNKQAPQPQL